MICLLKIFYLCTTIFSGKAAKIIHGVTIHSAFDFKWGNDYVPLGDKKLAQYREMFSELSLIVMDEISMVGSDMFYSICRRLCEILQSDEAFGNCGICGVGDLLQLKPVNGRYIFQEPYNAHYIPYFEVNNLWNLFDVVNLVHNHRQKEERQWTEILNKIRVNTIIENKEEKTFELEYPEIEDALKPRLLKPFKDKPKKVSKLKRKRKGDSKLEVNQVTKEDLSTIHVYYTNKDVNNHNDQCLNLLDNEKFVIDAVQSMPKGYKPKMKHGEIDDTGLRKKFSVKVGARVVLTNNLDVSDGLVNGSFGAVVGIEMKNSKVDCIVIEFDEDDVGIKQRQKHPQVSGKYSKQNGTPIYIHLQEYQAHFGSNRRSARAKVLQFPLRLAWAITCHKMQGQTVKRGSKFVAHWANNLPQAMAYVM